MKKKIRILNKLLIFSIIFMLFSCSEDLFDEQVKSQKHPILVQRKNFEDLKKNKKLMKSIEQFTIKVDNTLKKQHYDSINNFYIDIDDVMFTLDSLNHQTYTFKVSRLPDNGLFENLILKTSKDGGFDAILAQYNQTLLNSNLTIPQEIQNAINQDVTFTYLGKKTLSEINSKFSYNEECFEPGYVYVTTPGSSCASGNHSFGDGTDCNYWGTTAMATPGTSGYVFTMVGVACDNGGSGGGDFTTGPHGGGGGGENLTPPNPCNNLKKLFDPAKANIKPKIITDLQPNIAVNPSGEKGVSLAMNSSGVPTNTIIPPVIQPPLPIPTGVNYYSAIHTHPLDTYPMFSWSDVVVLNNLNNHSASHNQGLASFLLVCQDDNGVFQTYAIVFDPDSLNDTIDQFMGNPENNGCTSQEIEFEMNKLLGDEFARDNNYERAFLKFMSSSNVSLYRANSTLTNWSKLSLSNNSATATVNSTNCN